MTEIEKKALALAIEVREDNKMRLCPDPTLIFGNWEALCRAIEQHEAFRQKVSDAVEAFISGNADANDYVEWHRLQLSRFIIPKPVDPLVEALKQLGMSYVDADDFRVALAARGLEIREKRND